MTRSAALATAGLALFTVWITWRAKALELAGARPHSGSHLTLNKPAPGFRLTALDGRTVDLAEYRGRNVAITFWASWCGPCRMEMPVLRTFYEKARKQNSDFEILAISLDTERDDAAIAAKELKIPFPVLHDAGGKVSDQYGVDAIPTLFVVDKKGDLTYTSTGFNMSMEILLAQQLGIKNYSMVDAAPETQK
jgi:peroxiredoxin